MTVLPALFKFASVGRQAELYRWNGVALIASATGCDVPFPGTFPGITVAAGDIIERGPIKELVCEVIADHAGTVHLVNHVSGGTAIAGTLASIAVTANTQAGTIAVLSGTVGRISAKFINSAGAGATVTGRIYGR